MTDCYMYILSAECTKLFHDFTISLSPKGSRLNWVKMETTNTVCILMFSYSGIYALYDPALNTLLTNVAVKDKHISKLW